MRLAAALVDLRRLLDQHGGRRRLHHEREALVRVRGDDHRNRQAGLDTLRLRVERLAELHDVEAALTECGADRRTGIRLARRHLQLDVSDYFLRHLSSPMWVLAGVCPPRFVLTARKAKGRPELFAETFHRGKVSWEREARPKLCPVDLRFFNLRKIELDWGRATKDRHRHAQLALFVIHVLDVAVEVGERTFLDAHGFAHLEQHLWPRLLDAFLHLTQDRIDFLLRDRRRPVRRATNETSYLRRALDEVPRVVGHLHLDEHVAREELALGNRLLAALHLHHFLDRHEDLAELVLQLGALDPLGQRSLHALLESRVRVHDKPFLVRHHSTRPVISCTSHASVESTAKRNSAMMTTNANTIIVV